MSFADTRAVTDWQTNRNNVEYSPDIDVTAGGNAREAGMVGHTRQPDTYTQVFDTNGNRLKSGGNFSQCTYLQSGLICGGI